MLLKKIKEWIRNLIPNSCFFIQSGEVLPSPLSKEEEEYYLEQVELGNESAKDVLIEHNLRLVVYIAKRYDTNPTNMEDFISIGIFGLIKAINTFKRDKNIKLVTYASRCIENEILMYLRKKSKQRNEVSFDEPLNVDYDGNELVLADIIGTQGDIVAEAFEEKEKMRVLYRAINELKDREKEILLMRYGLNQEELTQKDVASKLGISQSYISRLEKRILSKLKLSMKKYM